MDWLIILLFCTGSALAKLSAVVGNSNRDLEDTILSLLQRLQLEKFFDTLLVYGDNCTFSALSARFPVSSVLVSPGSSNFDWNYSSLTLILSCGLEVEREENYRTLIKLQTNRRLIFLHEDNKPESVCGYYSKKEQYNIAMVRENFPQSGLIYSCRLFHDQKYEEVNIHDGKAIFIDQFRNMQRAPIRTITDNLAPRSMATIDPITGEKKWIGFVANLLNNFIEKVNATLAMQSQLAEVEGKIFFVNISKWTANDLLDIGMSVDTTWEMRNFDTFTYPYLMCSYCFMVPLPDKIPYNEVYGVIIDPGVLALLFLIFCTFSTLLIYIQKRSLSLTSVLMNDMCLRGFLCQTFPFPRQCSRKLKLMCLLLCFASLMTTTMYGAYLKAFLYSPPPQPMMRTFSDLERSRYKIAMNWAEMDMLRFENNRILPHVSNERVEIIKDYHEFVKLRESFNSNYVFPVTSVRWGTYDEQQKLLFNPVFYYSENIYLSRDNILSFPIRRHLPYRNLFEEHILRQKEFGLLNHWIDHSFLDMLRLELTPHTDMNEPSVELAIDVDDLYWILGLYSLALGICCCCFALEILGSSSRWNRYKIYISKIFRN